MTRINLVEPVHLSDKHLMAEYRELPRIFTAVKKLYDSGKTLSDVDIPEKYVLGKGHCKFFYNKLWWLHCRFCKLYQELRLRGFNLDEQLFHSVIKQEDDLAHYDNLFGGSDYNPSPEEIYLNMARLVKRSGFGQAIEESQQNS